VVRKDGMDRVVRVRVRAGECSGDLLSMRALRVVPCCVLPCGVSVLLLRTHAPGRRPDVFGDVNIPH